jgi:hypothetical protein
MERDLARGRALPSPYIGQEEPTMSTEIIELIMRILAVSPIPIKRRILRYQLCSFGVDLTDRTLRKIYERLPICSGDHGLFIPLSKQDVETYDKYLSKKIPPWKVKEKINRIKVCHPEWYPFEENQDLFK